MKGRCDHWILNGRVPEACGNWLRWAMWFEKADRRVARDVLADGAVEISTVFIGLDHQWGDGPPLIFETMIFGGSENYSMDRYSTWDEAEAGHARMLKIAKAATERSSVVAELLARVVIDAIKMAPQK